MRRQLILGFCLATVVGTANAQVTTQTVETKDANGNTQSSQVTTISGPNQAYQTGQAQQMAAQAQTAQIAASTAALPASGISPTTSVGTGAGAEEGSVLTAAATKVAASYIHSKVRQDRVLVFVGGATSTAPDPSPWLFFNNQTARLLNNLKTHSDGLHDYLEALKAQPKPRNKLFSQEVAGLPLAPLGAAIPLAMNLLSWGNTAYQTGGAALTPDDYMMDVALLQFEGAKGWKLYSQMPAMGLPSDIQGRLDDIDAAVQVANRRIVEGQIEVAKLQADPDAAKKDPLLTEIATINANITALNGDISAYSTFLTSLTGTGSVTWATVLQGRTFSDALQSGGGVIFVKVHSTAAGVLSKSNLWTSLGAPPLYVSLGMVVSYVYYPPQAMTSAAGVVGQPLRSQAEVFELMTRYHTADSVVHALAEDGRRNCDPASPARTKGSDADKYCPIVFARIGAN